MTILKVGADAGNSGLKLMVLGQDPLFIPSIYSHHIGEATNILSDEDIPVEELENNIDITISSPALSVNNMRYIVGQKVIEENIKGIEMEKKSDKSKDDLVVLVTLAGLAVSAIKKDPSRVFLPVPRKGGITKKM
ncbi:hypothetical protein EMIT079MI2_510011 [Bacillus sp. IT-79MI2]